MLREYQLKLGMDFSKMSTLEKIRWIKEYKIALICEQAEMIERMPWKPWRNYTEEEVNEHLDDDKYLEIAFEWIDCFFFLMDQALILDIDQRNTLISDLFLSKLEENLDRIKRGYSKSNTIESEK
jgi:hypothetical protein